MQNTPKDTLYDWLAIMFKFCWATPFAYHSLYVPSPKIHRLAWQHKVKVIPLQRLPSRLLMRHETFQFFNLTRNQWEITAPSL